MKRIAIIGGGMAGLAAAHELHTSDHTHWTLYESGERLGGKIITDHEDGFTVEGGPDSFITQKPWGLELCKELGLEDSLVPCNEGNQKIYILVNGELCPLPAGFRLTAPTRFWPFIRSPLFSWRGKLRVLLDLFISPSKKDEDESISSFLTRRMGREVADKIGGPLMAGIYVADPARLSLLSTFPMFREIERKYGSLIKGFRAAAKRPSSSQPMFMSLRTGMAELVDTITQPLQPNCRLKSKVQSISRLEDGTYNLTVSGNSETFDAVIIATPLFQTATLLETMEPETATTLAAIRYVSTATVSFGFKTPLKGMTVPLDGFGFVIPASERRKILACTWSSMKFPNRAPEGHALFRVFIGGPENEQLVNLSDDELTHCALSGVRSILGLEDEPVLTRLYRWPKGNPQYDVGHTDRMKQCMRRISKLPGLFLAGSGYNGVGLPDCIRSGRQAAQAALELT